MGSVRKRKWRLFEDRIILLTAVLLSVLLMVVDQDERVKRIKQFFIGKFGLLSQGTSYIPRLLSLRDDYHNLLIERANWSFEKNLYRDAIIENRRLRRLLEFKEKTPLHFIAAEVIGKDLIGMPGFILINDGWVDGTQKNMALVSDKGLIGRIVSVNRSTSIGQIITDPNYRVSARIQRSRVLGIVRWLYGNICTLEAVTEGSDVVVGDCVVTSGYSQIYPPGIVIGHIVEVNRKRGELFLYIILRTKVNFETLEEVLVMKTNDALNGFKTNHIK